MALTIIAEYNFFKSDNLSMFILNKFSRDRIFIEELRAIRKILEEKSPTQYLSKECYSAEEEYSSEEY